MEESKHLEMIRRIERQWRRRFPRPYEVRSGLTAEDVEYFTGVRPQGEEGELYSVEFY